MKKKLLLVTNGFPFGEYERGFLPTEFQCLTQNFQVTILAKKDGPMLYPFPKDVPVRLLPSMKPVRKGPKALLLLLSALFRPSVWREVLRAVQGCPKKTAFQRCLQILRYDLGTRRIYPLLRSIVDKDGIDLVYIYWCSEVTLGAVRLKKRRSGLKVVTRFHGYDLYQERTDSGWQPFRQEISEGCDRLIFACRTGLDYYLSHWGRRWQDKSVVGYLGSPASPLVPGSGRADALTLVSCSYMIPLKRIALIIDALARLPEGLALQWYHIGDGESRAALEEQAKAALTPRANIQWEFLGAVPNREVLALYQKIQPDIFMTTSSTEGGVPVSIQEAFSAGIPAIATAVGGIPELVRDGETGFLLSETPSIEEAAAAICRFYELPAAEKAAMARRARALWEEEFDAEKNAKVLTAILRQAVKGGMEHE